MTVTDIGLSEHPGSATHREVFSCAFSLPVRPAGSAPPSFPSLSALAIRSSGWPARTPRPPRFRRPGQQVERGTIDDLDVLRARGRASDGVIHLAFKHDIAFSGDFEGAADADRRAVETFGDALAGSDRPFVIASGTLGVGPGRVATERDGHGPARGRAEPRPATAPGTRAVYARAGCRGRPLVACCGCRRRCTATVTTASWPPSSASPATRASPATSATGRTAGPPCTGSTPRTCSGWRWSTPRRDRRCTRSPTRACRSVTSPR